MRIKNVIPIEAKIEPIVSIGKKKENWYDAVVWFLIDDIYTATKFIETTKEQLDKAKSVRKKQIKWDY